MNVTLPNGVVMEGVPDGTSKDMVMQKAILNGLAQESDFSSAQPAQEQAVAPDVVTTTEPEEQGFLSKASDFITGADRSTPEMESMGEIGNAPELNEMSWSSFKTALGLLATGDETKAKSVIQSNIPEAKFTEDSAGNVIVNLPSGQYALNKPGVSGQDIIKGVFDMLAFTPAGRGATVANVAGRSAATEAALQGATQQVGGGDVDIKDIAFAGALGGAGKGLENVIGTGYRALKGNVPDEAAGIIREGADAGIPVMTSDVIEPTTFAGKMARSTGEKIPLVGTGAARAEQQAARQEAVSQFVDKYQAPSYKEIVDSLKNKSKGVKSAAGSILNKTGVKLDELGDIPTVKTSEAIDSAITELSKTNVRLDESAAAELTELKNLMDMPQTFSSLKENRTIARDVLDSFGKGDRSQLPTRSKSLIQKAVVGMGKDMDEFAKSNLTPKEYGSWKKANQIYAGEAIKLKKSKIKNILDKGDVTPENVESMLFSKKPSEVKSLYDSLTTKGKDNARSALIYKAFDNSSKRAGGVTPNSFASELNKIAKNTGVFFKGEQKKQLEGFKRLIESTRRAQDAAVETPTGQQVLGAGAGYAAFTDLGATLGLGGTAGGLARLYESAPVRNALLRLGSVPKGSDRYQQALSEAQAVMTAAGQSIRREEEE